jgi:hypothetical protein
LDNVQSTPFHPEKVRLGLLSTKHVIQPRLPIRYSVIEMGWRRHCTIPTIIDDLPVEPLSQNLCSSLLALFGGLLALLSFFLMLVVVAVVEEGKYSGSSS